MGSRKFVIIIGVVVLVAIAIVGIIALTKKTPGPVQQKPDNTSQNNGGVVQVKPSPTPFGRSGFHITLDPAAPYAPNLPRTQEPAAAKPSASGSGNFADYNAAVKNGQIPNENGLYNQVVIADPVAAAYAAGNGVDYSLPAQQFLQTYYPNYVTVIAGNNNAEPDTIVTNNNPPISSVSPINRTVPIVPGVDPKLFLTINTSDKTTLTAYVQTLSGMIQNFDILNDQTLISKIFTDATTATQLADMKNKAKAIQDQVVSLQVPQSMLGLAESTYQLYGIFQVLIDDRTALNNITKANGEAVAAKAQSDSDQLDTISTEINSDIDIIRNILAQ